MKTENTTTHTPGPWKLPFSECVGGAKYLSALKSGDHEWARLEQSIIGKGGAELEANARLIAASPDLLAALDWLVKCANPYVFAQSPRGNGR